MKRLGFLVLCCALLVPMSFLLPVGCGPAATESGASDRIFAEADRLYSEGRLAEAEERLTDLTRRLPENPRPYNNLGNIRVRMGKISEAQGLYRKALDLNPGYLVARLNLAVLSLRHGETDEALRLFQEGKRDYPENAALHNGLGICELRKGRVRKAIDHFRKAVDIEGAVPVYYNNLAYAYTEANEYLNEALKLAKEAVAKDPENPVFLDTLGWVYFKRGVFDQAETTLRHALDLEPGSKKVRSHLVSLYRWLGEDEKAVNLIKEGIRGRIVGRTQGPGA